MLSRSVAATLALALLAAACGGNDDDGDTSPTAEGTPTAVVGASATVPPTQTASPSATSTTPANQPATPTAAQPVLDEDSLDFLRLGLWSVPESNTRCGFDGAFDEAPGTLTLEYQDPSDDGDFYVVCYTTRMPPGPGLVATVRDPRGTLAGRATIDPGGATETVSGFEVEPLIITTDSGHLLYNGIARFDEDADRHVTQLHLWLPHDRIDGTWTVEIEQVIASVEVAAPCSTGAPPFEGDPFVYPTDIDFVRHGDRDITRHCLLMPDVVGAPVATAEVRIRDVLLLRGAEGAQRFEIPDDALRPVCSDAHAQSIVVAQQPPALSFPIEIDDEVFVTLDVSTGPCQTPTPQAIELAPY